MGRPRKTGRRRTTSKCKSGRRCKGTRRTSKRTHSKYVIPKTFACDGMRGPATSVITTNGMYNTVKLSPGFDKSLFTHTVGDDPRSWGPPRKTTNSSFMTKLADVMKRPHNFISAPMKTTNGGWSKQQVDDQQSSGLGFGPRPFRTG